MLKKKSVLRRRYFQNVPHFFSCISKFKASTSRSGSGLKSKSIENKFNNEKFVKKKMLCTMQHCVLQAGYDR